MDTSTVSVLLYPYPYQIAGLAIFFIVLVVISSVAHGIYRLISSKMDLSVNRFFYNLLKISGISIGVLFFIEVTLSLITIYNVNEQLGFCYATPETPEEELFEITKVISGKTMDRAGLKPSDEVQMKAVNQLYTLLINNQGKEVVIPILRDKKKINILVSVPQLDVPLESVSLLF